MTKRDTSGKAVRELQFGSALVRCWVAPGLPRVGVVSLYPGRIVTPNRPRIIASAIEVLETSDLKPNATDTRGLPYGHALNDIAIT